VQALDHGGVFGGDAVAKRLGTVGRRNSGGVEQVFAAPRNTVQRAAVFSGGNFFVSFLGLGEREIGSQRDDAAQLGVEILNAR